MTDTEGRPAARACACGKFRRDQPYRPRVDCRTCWQQYHVPDAADLVARGPEAVRGRMAELARRIAPGAIAPTLPPDADSRCPAGRELKALLASLGIRADGCGGCNSLARQMDVWGAAGCGPLRSGPARETVLVRLRAQVRGATWRTKLVAAARSAAQGLYFDPTDPAPGLLDEAIRRAEVKSRGGPGVLPNAADPTSGDAAPLTGDGGEAAVQAGGDGAGGGGGAGGDVVHAPGGAGGAGGTGDGVQPDAGRAYGSAGGRDVCDGPVLAADPGGGVEAGPAGGAGPDVRPDRAGRPLLRPGRALKWAYGVTTVPRRRADLLPRTLASLAAGGFERPWLFVDGCDDLQGWRREFGAGEPDGRVAGVTCRYPLVRAYASWCLALAELYARDPLAGRYAVFQDDFECVRNLRDYLESIPFPEKAYWNLYLGPWNDQGRNFTGRHKPPYFDDKSFVGFTAGDQGGRGALGLVFDRDTVQLLLSSRYVVDRPLQRHKDGWGLSPRGFKFIDAAVVEALRPLGYTELVHHPSLVRHTGVVSTIDKRPHVTAHDPRHPLKRWQRDAEGLTFPGTGFDARTWIKG